MKTKLTCSEPVSTPRRHFLQQLAGVPLVFGGFAAPAIAGRIGPLASDAGRGGLNGSREHFAFSDIYLNAASMHPIPQQSAEAIQRYLNVRLMNDQQQHISMSGDRNTALTLFSQLFNAGQDELAWVPSTTVAENLVVAGLGLHQRGQVITDVYHFSGSLYMYNEFAKQGMKVEVVAARDNRIYPEDIARAIKPDTRLIALTQVSNIAGFQHDLTAVCELAHSKGVMVYADIIQAAGTTPLDLRASGVDFAACSTYKWLMGDFGIGIMYARRESQTALLRSQIGFRQEGMMQTHYLPFDPPGNELLKTAPQSGLAGRVGVGTLGSSGVSALTHSLAYLLELGVERIEAWRQPLLQRLRQEITVLGYKTMTPTDSRSAILSFACENAPQSLNSKLAAAGISISVYPHYFRISPSFYNSMEDIEQLIRVLAKR